MNNRRLHHELISAGASDSEASELELIAARLGGLNDVSEPGKKVIRHAGWKRFVPTTAAAVVFLLVGMTGVTFAQSSLPGSVLYPVKRLSENAMVKVDPNYRATLMMRRAEEVKALIGEGASSQRVLATLDDYSAQAGAYKTKDYAAFSYCKTNLQQAETKANPAEKQEIASTLRNLSDTD